MTKSYHLERFLTAQEETYPIALAEIKQGRKRSHWMWYIFPQIRGLGSSDTSRFYAIQDIHEAEAYLKHATLGSRLIHIANELLELPTDDARSVFGSPDNLKLKSSMTLFSALPNADPVFQLVLDKFFQGMKDDKTLARIV